MTPNQLPPLPAIDPVLGHPEHHMKWTRPELAWIQQYATDYALAALAQQAQEPVAWRWMPSQEFPMWIYSDDKARVMEALRFMGHGGVQPLYTPPAPQPAPVDDREAWLPIEADTVPDRSKLLFWLLVDGSPVLGYFVEIPFREIRDADGRYIYQQDADAFWATQATGDQVEPTHYCELMPPKAPQTKGQP